jgi:PAS domain S-box-containing protein
MKAIATDATERSIPAEDTLRLVIDTTPALIHTGRPEGYLDYFNRRWLEFFGLPLEKVCGWQSTDAVHPEAVAGMLQKWHAALATGEPFEAEARVRRADGEYRLLLHRKVPLCDESDAIVKWFGSSIDIQDRKLAQDQLRRVVHATPALLHSARPDGYVDFVNKGWLEFVGLSSKEMVGWGWTKCFHPDDVNEYVAKWRAALASGEPFQAEGRVLDFEHRLLMPDGSIKHVHVLAQPFKDQCGKVEFVGAVMDVTDSKKAFQEIQALKDFTIDQSWLSGGPVPTSSADQASIETSTTGERELIEAALTQTKGKVSGLSGAAAKLGIPASTLESKIRSLKINKYRFKER